MVCFVDCSLSLSDELVLFVLTIKYLNVHNLFIKVSKKLKVLNITLYYMIVAWSSFRESQLFPSEEHVWTHIYIRFWCNNLHQKSDPHYLHTATIVRGVILAHFHSKYSSILHGYPGKSRTNHVSRIRILHNQSNITGRYTNQII